MSTSEGVILLSHGILTVSQPIVDTSQAEFITSSGSIVETPAYGTIQGPNLLAEITAGTSGDINLDGSMPQRPCGRGTLWPVD